MVTYMIETAIGICECYEVGGIYFPLHSADCDRFIGEDIIDIERNDNAIV
jgi:hypothetical protein